MTSLTSTTPWENLSPKTRQVLVWALWFLTWILLLLGCTDADRRAWNAVVAVSAVHALAFLALFRGAYAAFPVQVRIAYFLWVLIGTYMLPLLMYESTVGLFTNLFFGYCPLARLVSLCSWNRWDKEERMSWNLVWRTFVSKPSAS